ncbi:MAG: TetR/AcrR family transcriptional regulator [Pseudomonadota bacterium]
MNSIIDPLEPDTTQSKRERQKEAKRLALTDAALAVFSRVGFAAAKIEDVAEEAGVSKGTVYLYFESKEQLFEEMVKAKMSPMLSHMAGAIEASSGSATDRLLAQMRFFYSRVLNCDRRQIMRLIMAEGPNFPHLAEFYHANILSRGQAMIEAIIQDGVESGEFRQMQGHGLMQNIAAGALVAAIWKTVFDRFQPLDLDAYFETHIDLILNGLKAAPTEN